MFVSSYYAYFWHAGHFGPYLSTGRHCNLIVRSLRQLIVNKTACCESWKQKKHVFLLTIGKPNTLPLENVHLLLFSHSQSWLLFFLEQRGSYTLEIRERHLLTSCYLVSLFLLTWETACVCPVRCANSLIVVPNKQPERCGCNAFVFNDSIWLAHPRHAYVRAFFDELRPPRVNVLEQKVTKRYVSCSD